MKATVKLRNFYAIKKMIDSPTLLPDLGRVWEPQSVDPMYLYYELLRNRLVINEHHI